MAQKNHGTFIIVNGGMRTASDMNKWIDGGETSILAYTQQSRAEQSRAQSFYALEFYICI